MYQGLSSLQAGMLSSALEHTVPEQIFSTATQKAQAVSTVKLLNLAAHQQGIPILHITPANSAITIPSLQLAPAVIAEIQTAVAVRKEVIVHQSNITAFGWTGAGYVVLDPVTGDAAWRISGVGNGAAFLIGWLTASLMVAAMYSFFLPGSTALLASTAIIGALLGLMVIQLLNLMGRFAKTTDPVHVVSCAKFGMLGFLTFFGKKLDGDMGYIIAVLGHLGLEFNSNIDYETCVIGYFREIIGELQATF